MRKTTRTWSSNTNSPICIMTYSLQSIFTHIMSPIWTSSLHFIPPNCKPAASARHRGPHRTLWCPPGPLPLLRLQEACPDLDSPFPPSQRKGYFPQDLLPCLPCLPESQSLKEGLGLIPLCPEGQLRAGTWRLLAE